MGVLKNDVGRPSNKTIRIRNILKTVFFVGIICIIYVIVNYDSKKLKGLTTDVEAPTLSYFNVSNISAVAGEGIKVETDIKDDISGIADFRAYYVDYKNQDGMILQQFSANVIDGIMFIPNNVKPGNYTLVNVEVSDKQGNSNRLYSIQGCEDFSYYNEELNKKYCSKIIEFKNTSLDILPSDTDIEAPVLHEISIDKTTAKPGDVITISAVASDNKSGIKNLYVHVTTKKEDDGASDAITMYYDNASGKYIGKYTIPSVGSTLYIKDIKLYDFNDNSESYMNKNLYPNFSNPKFLLDNVIIEGGIDDKERPHLIDYEFSTNKIDAPYNLPISLTVSDDFGISHAYVLAKKKELVSSFNTPYVYAYFTCEAKTGEQTCTSTMELNQYLEKGEYAVYRVEIVDLAGNANIYDISHEEGKQEGFEVLKNVKTFEIESIFSYNLTVSTDSKDIVNSIKQAEVDANIAIDCTSNPIIKKEIFEAIKDTNKKIYIETNGITWVFNGKDIKEPKDININVSFNYLYQDSLNKRLSDQFEKALVINFEDNGILPGKALIRVKADYTLSDYLGNSLYVMYYDLNSNMFDMVAKEVKVSDAGYYEFYISHNSSYILSNDEPEEEKITNNEEDLKNNENKNYEDTQNNVIENNKENTSKTNYKLFGLIGIGFIVIVISIIFISKYRKKKYKRKIK